MKNFKLVLILCLFMQSCAVGPNYKRPPMDLPSAAENEDVAPFVKPDWWTMFNDPVLNSLVEEALANNKSLQAVIAQVDQAKAQLSISRADLMPQITADGQGSYGTLVNGQRFSNPVQGYIATADASYSFDIWGKNRRLTEAAKAEYYASGAGRDYARLVLAVNTIGAYYLILTLDAQLKITSETLSDDQKVVSVLKNRVDAGLAGELDLRRAEADSNGVLARQEDLKRQLSQAQSALLVILGRSPKDIVEGSVTRGKTLDEIQIIPDVPQGIPSTLLARRPDVYQAEQQLRAANAQIGAARAQYFPDISLTAAAGYVSGALSGLFSGANGGWNFAGAIGLPIFEGGRIRAQNKAAQAAYREMLADYELAVQTAFKDVLDALTDNEAARKIYSATDDQVYDMLESYRISQDQFDAGLIDTIDLLDVKRELLSSQTNLAQEKYAEIMALVNVARALGGGWQEGNFTPDNAKESK